MRHIFVIILVGIILSGVLAYSFFFKHNHLVPVYCKSIVGNNVLEKVKLYFNGINYCVVVCLTNIGNKPITLQVTNLFRPNSIINPFAGDPVRMCIFDPQNNKTYAIHPVIIPGGPMVIPENYTFCPGETMWFKEIIYCVYALPGICYEHNISNNSVFYLTCRATTLLPGKYEIFIHSLAGNLTIPFDPIVPVGDYVFHHDGKVYVILPKNATKIIIDGISSNLISVNNYTYEIVNQQLVQKLNSCLGCGIGYTNLGEIKVWINGKEYCIPGNGITYCPCIIT